MPSTENELSFQWKPIMDFYIQIMYIHTNVCFVCFTYKVAIVRNIQKGVLCLCFPICLLFYLSFYLKIVHTNSTALSSQQYMCIHTCIATNPNLLPFVLCKRSPEKKPQAVTGTSLNTYTVPRAVLQWLGVWVLQQQRNELPKWILNYIKSSKYSWNNRWIIEREQTFWSGTIVIFCWHPLTAQLHSQSNVFKQIPGK